MSERDLQQAIQTLLGYKGIQSIRSRMDTRTSNNLGTPDFLFAVKGQAVAWEAKLPKKPLSLEQSGMRSRLEKNGWRYSIIHTIDEAINELKTYERTEGTRTTVVIPDR